MAPFDWWSITMWIGSTLLLAGLYVLQHYLTVTTLFAVKIMG